jgi:transporter family-2 protein
MNPGWALWAAAAGAGIPVMAALNGALSRHLGSTPAAAVVLFLVALAGAGAVLAFAGSPARLGLVGQAPLLLFVGGVIVCAYVLSVTHLAPRFGVANTILFVMTAQVLTSSAIDHYGLFGTAVRPVDGTRLLGLALLLAGLALTQLAPTGDARG